MSEHSSTLRSLQQSLVPALAVGAVTGVTGLVGGAIAGRLFSQHPLLFTSTSGLQWFGLGSTFWYVRNVIAPANGSLSKRERVFHSTFAGSVAGAVNGAFRSRSNALPGAIVFGIFGMLGQGAYESLQADGADEQSKVPYTQRLLQSRWMPLKRLSYDDYLGVLNEKSIRIDAEIAIIDEKIAGLQRSKVKAHLEDHRKNHDGQVGTAN